MMNKGEGKTTRVVLNIIEGKNLFIFSEKEKVISNNKVIREFRFDEVKKPIVFEKNIKIEVETGDADKIEIYKCKESTDLDKVIWECEKHSLKKQEALLLKLDRINLLISTK